MKTMEAARKFRAAGLEVREHGRNHLSILRSRHAKFQGPRCVAWWPESRRKTAHDVNLDFTWSPATYEEVYQCVMDDEGFDGDTAFRAVS